MKYFIICGKCWIYFLNIVVIYNHSPGYLFGLEAKLQFTVRKNDMNSVL